MCFNFFVFFYFGISFWYEFITGLIKLICNHINHRRVHAICVLFSRVKGVQQGTILGLIPIDNFHSI